MSAAEALITLRDGASIIVRRVTPGDAPLLAEGFARLSATSRRLRFLTGKHMLTQSELRYFTTIDGHDHEALGAIDPDSGNGVGIARFVRDLERPDRAEVAVAVADDYQRRGVGTALLTRLAARARAEDVRYFTALIAGENRTMQDILNRLGTPVRVHHARDGTVEYEIELPKAGLGAQLAEALRAAAAGRFNVHPAVREALRGVLPTRPKR